MRETCFKLFELPTHQVLVAKDLNEDTENPLITLSVFLLEPGVEGRVNMSFEYKTDEDRDEIFDEFAEKDAQEFLDTVLESASQMGDDEESFAV